MRTSLFFICSFFVIFTHSLSAFEMYEGLWGGLSIAEDHIHGYDIDFDLGGAGGVLIGTKVFNMFRAEVEGSYRQNHIADIKVGGLSSTIHGSHREFSLMTNFLYDLPYGFYKIVPYLGFGIGWGYERTELKGGGLSKVETHDSSFTGQAIAGLSYRCNRMVSFFLSGRYYLFDDDIQSYSVCLGLIHHL